MKGAKFGALIPNDACISIVLLYTGKLGKKNNSQV